MSAVTKRISQLGFTLIELMVVIAIIGLLMAAGLVSYTSAQKNARDAKREADIDAVGKAMEQYNGANSTYPVMTYTASFTTANLTTAGITTAYLPAGAPTDPRNTGLNIYTIASTATGFCTCAGLENLGRGNATAAAPTTGAAVCSFGTPAAGAQGYYCVQNQQ